MKRVGRHLFTLCAAASLLLCVAVGVQWARGGPLEVLQAYYNRWPQSDEVYTYYVSASSYSGTFRLRFNRQHFDPRYFVLLPDPVKGQMRHEYHPPGVTFGAFRDNEGAASPPRPGFGAGHHVFALNTAHHGDDWHVSFRPWLPMALSLVMPALWLHRFLRARRDERLGLCVACGYDLRASLDRCPECGMLPRIESVA
jgi:hypothetical protein